jgi:hypothetical protein
MNQNFERQDIGYLLTAYADGQLAPEGVMWVEEQLDANPDLRARLKEIRQLQAGLRAAFAGGAPDFVLDLPRREALLASAANPPRKTIRFSPPVWIGLAASVMAVVYLGMQMTQPLGHPTAALRTQELAEGQATASPAHAPPRLQALDVYDGSVAVGEPFATNAPAGSLDLAMAESDAAVDVLHEQLGARRPEERDHARRLAGAGTPRQAGAGGPRTQHRYVPQPGRTDAPVSAGTTAGAGNGGPRGGRPARDQGILSFPPRGARVGPTGEAVSAGRRHRSRTHAGPGCTSHHATPENPDRRARRRSQGRWSRRGSAGWTGGPGWDGR